MWCSSGFCPLPLVHERQRLRLGRVHHALRDRLQQLDRASVVCGLEEVLNALGRLPRFRPRLRRPPVQRAQAIAVALRQASAKEGLEEVVNFHEPWTANPPSASPTKKDAAPRCISALTTSVPPAAEAGVCPVTANFHPDLS